MRTHILFILTALIVTACASKREIASTQDNNDQNAQHASRTTGASERDFGNSRQ
jgi:hypothetical protein